MPFPGWTPLDFADGARAVDAFGGQRGQQLGDGLLKDRMTPLRGDLGQRFEDKTALGQRRVGNREAAGADDLVVDQQQVQIERARAFGDITVAVAAIGALGGEEKVEQAVGIEAGFHHDDSVHKGGLIHPANGLGAVEGGGGEDEADGGKVIDGGANSFRGAPRFRGQVCANADGRSMPHTATLPESGPDAPTRYSQNAMKIGFFGGSFDPPHRGHIALARLALDRLELERVLLAPVGVQPLKRDRPQAGYDDRVAMTRLAIAGQARLEVSLVDAPRTDHRPNYTIDTIRALRATLAPDDHLFCLLGADSFLSIGKWYRAADLLLACDFAVAARPGFDLRRVAAALPASISVASCDSPHPEPLVLCLRGTGRGESRLYLLPDLDEVVSASSIRSELEQGAHPRQVLDPAVAAYIREHRLYQTEAAS